MSETPRSTPNAPAPNPTPTPANTPPRDPALHGAEVDAKRLGDLGLEAPATQEPESVQATGVLGVSGVAVSVVEFLLGMLPIQLESAHPVHDTQ